MAKIFARPIRRIGEKSGEKKRIPLNGKGFGSHEFAPPVESPCGRVCGIALLMGPLLE
jgi:hypothetical protein